MRFKEYVTQVREFVSVKTVMNNPITTAACIKKHRRDIQIFLKCLFEKTGEHDNYNLNSLFIVESRSIKDDLESNDFNDKLYKSLVIKSGPYQIEKFFSSVDFCMWLETKKEQAKRLLF